VTLCRRFAWSLSPSSIGIAYLAYTWARGIGPTRMRATLWKLNVYSVALVVFLWVVDTAVEHLIFSWGPRHPTISDTL
jgi:hypothetical protein